MTPEHSSGRRKQALLAQNFQGRERGEYFSSRDYGITGDQECVQIRNKIAIAVVNTLSNQSELSVQQ